MRWETTNDRQALAFVASSEQEQVSRGLLSWLNEYPSLPAGVRMIDFEYLADDTPGLTLSTIQGAYITRRYLGGDYMAEYQFKLIYRAQPGDSRNNRLKMDETLDALGDWAVARAKTDKPDIGAGKQVRGIVCNTRSSLFGRYENGDEDHQILMTMHYYAAKGA